MVHEGLTRAIDAVSEGVVHVPNGEGWQVVQALELLRRCVAATDTMSADRDGDRIRFAIDVTLKCLGSLWAHKLTCTAVSGFSALVIWEAAVEVAWCVLREEAAAAIRAVRDMTEVPRGE